MSRWLIANEVNETIASKFLKEFDEISLDAEFDNGMKDHTLLREWRDKAEQEAINVEDAVENSISYDESVIYTFKDGSKLQLDNPRQAAFSAHVKIIE